MKRLLCSSAAALLLTALTPVFGWSQQYYLYSPAPLEAPNASGSREGVTVQEVTVQKGDTLYGLSRRFSGRGSYYPQILLFNSIKNPNLIYPGEVFRVPLSGRASAVVEQHAASAERPLNASAAVAVESSVPAANNADLVVGKKQPVREKGGTAKKVAASKSPAAPAVVPTSAGQQVFENAVRAYRQDDCKTALELFDRFLAGNQGSPLAADASFYKAECYLKLSK